LRGRPRPFFRLGQRAADDRGQLLEIERLRQIFVRAALGRADRGHERVLGAHNDDRQIRPRLLDAQQQIERVFVRQHDIADDEVAVTLADPAPQRRGIAGRAHVVSGAGQRLIKNGADCRVVVGNENVSRGHLMIP
jgi:hypothetical protein